MRNPWTNLPPPGCSLGAALAQTVLCTAVLVLLGLGCDGRVTLTLGTRDQICSCFFSGGLTCALAKCAMVNSWILKPYWGSSIHEVRDLLAQRVWIPIRDDHKPWHKWCERDKLYDQLFENWMSKAICGLCVETDCMFTTWVKHFVRLGVYIVYDNVKDLFKGCSVWSSSESTGKARKSLLQRILIEVWLWPSSCVGSH